MSQLLADPPLRSMPERSRAKMMSASQILIPVAIVAILVTAVVFRTWRLGSVPGLNGDEAWSGVQAARFLHGEPIAWRTPTGNPINMFFLGPEVLLHTIGKRSIALLRIVPLVSGLLALVVNFWLCGKVFDRKTAITSTLLLAALPINIAYSRFAWDASQSLLATLPVVYLSLLAVRNPERYSRYLAQGVLALAAAVLVHPTNVFVAPLLVVALLYVKWEHVQPLVVRCRTETKLQTLLFGVGMVAVGAAWLNFDRFRPITSRLVSLADMIQSAILYFRLFSGATIYEFISRSDLQVDDGFLRTIYSLGMVIVFLAALWTFVRRVYAERDPADRVLFYGSSAVLLGFYLVAGPRALLPHFERYAMCLMAPSVAMFARGLGTWGGQSPGALRSLARGGALMLCAALLIGFYANYLREFAVSGGQSHEAFQTGETDPKQQAVEYLLARQTPGKETWIAAENWWTYWPAVYFSYGAAGVHVVDRTKPFEIPLGTSAEIWDLVFTPTKGSTLEPDLTRSDEREDFAGTSGFGVITIFRRETKKLPE